MWPASVSFVEDPANLWNSNDDLALLSNLADAIRGHSFNAAIFAAELPEALTTVTNTTRAVLGAFGNVAHGRFGAAARQLGTFSSGSVRALKSTDVSSAWLALRYGWEPLIQDCYAAMQFIASRSNDPRTVVFRARKVKISRREQSTNPSQYSLPGRFISGKSVKYVLTERLSTARSLGLLDPASVLWEKLPYSFVVDWFIPIGNYLSALGLFPFLDASGIITTYKRSNDSFGGWVTGPGVSVSGGSYSGFNLQVVRSLGVLSVPRPEFKTISKALSLGHIQNAAALVWQQIANAKR